MGSFFLLFLGAPDVSIVERLKAHSVTDLDTALSEPLPFKIFCTEYKYCCQFSDILEYGNCEYTCDVFSFLEYHVVGSSEVSVWSITSTILSFLTKCLPGLHVLYRNQIDPSSQKRLRPDDALYVNNAHACRFESKTLTENLSTEELFDKLTDEAYSQFPDGSDSILGFCTSIEVARVFKIKHGGVGGGYIPTLIEGFDLTSLDGRLKFLVFLCKVARWLIAIKGPRKSFHLVPGIQVSTPNGHTVVYTKDSEGSYILKKFSTQREIRLDLIKIIFDHKLTNIGWGQVVDEERKEVKLRRIGYTLLHAMREKLVDRDVVVGQVRDGLDQLHSLGIAHCDIKAENIFVDRLSLIAFIDDLEYVRPIDAPVPEHIELPQNTNTSNAIELDKAQYNSFVRCIMRS